MSKKTEAPKKRVVEAESGAAVRVRQVVSMMGVTVAELKKHIAAWPETDAMGEPTEVWLETGHQLSSPCMSIELLNYRMRDDGTHTSDLLLCPCETAWNSANEKGQR